MVESNGYKAARLPERPCDIGILKTLRIRTRQLPLSGLEERAGFRLNEAARSPGRAVATGGDDWLDLPNVWPDLTSAPLIGEASVIAAVAAAFRARARNQEQQDRCDYKTRAGRSLLLFQKRRLGVGAHPRNCRARRSRARKLRDHVYSVVELKNPAGCAAQGVRWPGIGDRFHPQPDAVASSQQPGSMGVEH